MGKANGQRIPKPKGHNRQPKPKPKNRPAQIPQTPQTKTTIRGPGRALTPSPGTSTTSESTQSFYSRAVSGSSNSSVPDRVSDNIIKKQGFDFLRLPGEVRNQIYELAFPPKEFHIQWLTKDKDLTYSIWRGGPLYKPLLDRTATARRRCQDYKRRSHEANPPKLVLAPGPAALMLTCKQIHNEVIGILYGGSCFAFNSVRVLEKFLDTINGIAKLSITKLYLRHGTYGEPRFQRDHWWKMQHDDRWEFACWRISKCCPNLRELEVRLQINDLPLNLNLKANWVQPLLCFCDRKLKKFDLTLTVRSGYGLDCPRLQNCAEVVRREVLDDAYKPSVKEVMGPVGPKPLPKARILRIISA